MAQDRLAVLLIIEKRVLFRLLKCAGKMCRHDSTQCLLELFNLPLRRKFLIKLSYTVQYSLCFCNSVCFTVFVRAFRLVALIIPENIFKLQLAIARLRLHTSMMSICLSVCLSVCLSPRCKKT